MKMPQSSNVAAYASFFRVSQEGRRSMTVARVTEITSSSEKSFEDAVKEGIKRAAKTLDNVKGAWIQDQEVVIDDDKIKEYRVHLKVTFVLHD
jgi:flavin-binding protein dodecin